MPRILFHLLYIYTMYCKNKLRISMVFKALLFADRRPDHQLHDLLSVVPNQHSNSIHSPKSTPRAHQIYESPLNPHWPMQFNHSITSEGAVCSSQHAKWWSDVGLANLKHLHTSKLVNNNYTKVRAFPSHLLLGKTCGISEGNPYNIHPMTSHLRKRTHLLL